MTDKGQQANQRRVAVRVTPRASSNRVVADGDVLRVYVTTAPENGKANDAVRKVLAKHFGVPKTSIELLSGAKSRDKLFCLP